MMPSFRSLAIGAFAALITSTAAIPQSSSGSSTSCNNSPDLCSRNYNNITHLGAHGSSFLRTGKGISTAGNQHYNATDALDAGVRLLQAQVHKENSSLVLCHTTCGLMDAGPLDAWLTTVREWMDGHKNDVVTVVLVNSDDAPASEFATAFKTAGLDGMAYSPTNSTSSSSPSSGKWPTLQSMIDEGKRLVSFVTNVKATADYPYILPEFDHVFETPFEVTELSGFNCTADRPSSLSSASSAVQSGLMGMVNHFKYRTILTSAFVPDIDSIATVNDPGTQQGNVGLHLQQCREDFGVVPTFVLVDFWNDGDVFAAVDKMNSVSGSGRKDFAAGDASTTGTSMAVGRQQTFGAGAVLALAAAAVLIV